MLMLRVTIDTDRCIGCGLCEETMPDLFRVGPFHASTDRPAVPNSLHPALSGVAGQCPVSAIRVTGHSLHLAKNDDQEGDGEEEHREIGQYEREYRHFPN
jgi:ferredoxin